MAGTCPWHSDLRRGEGHSQPPDYRTYSAEVTGSRRNLPHHRSTRFRDPRMVFPARALLSYSIDPILSSTFSLFFIKFFPYFWHPRRKQKDRLLRKTAGDLTLFHYYIFINKEGTRCSCPPSSQCRGSCRCRCTARSGNHSTWWALRHTGQTTHHTPSVG